MNSTAFKNASVDESGEGTMQFLTGMKEFAWVDYCGFLLEGCLMLVGSGLNGFIFWVLYRDNKRANNDIIQMNLAAHDAIHGILTTPVFVAARLVLIARPWSGLKYFFVSILLTLDNINFEDMVTTLLTIMRTKQVKATRQASLFSDGMFHSFNHCIVSLS